MTPLAKRMQHREWVDCACGCGARFLPVIFGTKYFNEAHRDEHHNAKKRAASRKDKAKRHPNTVLIWQLREEMDREGKAGLCIYCERTLPPRRALICGLPDDIGEDCKQEYNSDWKRGRTMNERLAREQQQAA